MRLRIFGLGVLAGTLLVLGGGCGKSDTANHPVTTPPPPLAANPETIARVHWVGKERLGSETNATYLMSLWRMPEAERLEAQTLDKLAAALCGERPVAESTGPSASTNQAAGAEGEHRTSNVEHPTSNLTDGNASTNSIRTPQPVAPKSDVGGIRNLLADVLLKETYLELRQAGSNGPTELALALRLGPDRAAFWQTNLASALEGLTGVRPTPSAAGTGWELPAASLRSTTAEDKSAKFRAGLSRAGDWTVVDFIQLPPGQDPSTVHPQLPAEFAAHLAHAQGPFLSVQANNWLDTDLDLGRVVQLSGPGAVSGFSTFSPQLATNLPRIVAGFTGDGRNVHTVAELEFPHPLGLRLDPWNVPTNLVYDPLIGFMAVRGIGSWVGSNGWWSELGLGTAPNQAYFWAQHGLQRFHFVAMPSAQASNQVTKLSELVLDQVNPIISTAAMKLGKFHLRTNSPGFAWRGFPMISPSLSYTNFGGNQFIVAGFSPQGPTNAMLSEALFQQLYGSSNLVCYDWERTSECAEGLTQLAQMVRYMFSRARLTQTAGLTWLIAASPKLGPAVTGVTAPSPTELRVNRTSTMGLTGIELQFFIDWLESPGFPRGLHTFLAKPQPPPTAAQQP